MKYSKYFKGKQTKVCTSYGIKHNDFDSISNYITKNILLHVQIE